MSTHDKDTPQEDLDRLAAKYRRETGDEPPGMLDQAVPNAAGRAVESRTTRPWNFGWMHATASVALIVVGLAIVLDLRNTAEIAAPAERPPVPLRDQRMDAEPTEEKALDTREAYRQGEAVQMEAQQEARKSELLRALREQVLEPVSPGAGSETPLVIIRPAPPLQQAGAQDATPAEMDRDADLVDAKRGRDATQDLTTHERSEDASGTWKLESDGDVLVFSTAEEWLDYILGLQQVGEEAAWRSELEAFRLAFPGHPVPQALLDALDGAPEGDG